MESPLIKLKERLRKRKRKDVASVETSEVICRSIKTRSKALLGSYVRKEIDGHGVLLGKVVEYDNGVYIIHYHNNVYGEMGNHVVRHFLIKENEFDDQLLMKKKELDEIILGQCTQRMSMSYDTPVVLPPQLPPSTGNIGVPDECVADLLSVYSFLRSFSIPLFLYPFGLEDFVGSLNCSVQNTLLDAIHIALMRCLQRHYETLLLEGSELASRCIRSMDWSLIDIVTWPISLVRYLVIMKYTEGHHWKEFYSNALQKDYYALPVGSKLMVLQILCDNALDSEEIRAEIDMHEASEVVTADGVIVVASEGRPRRVHPRLSKTSAWVDQEVMDIADKRKLQPSHDFSSLDYSSSAMVSGANDQDGNGYVCRLCGMDGTLLCCDGCPSVYHSRCIGVSNVLMPEGEWYCPECTINKTDERISKGISVRGGAEVFAVDPYGQVFMGTCNHLLVMNMLIDTDPCITYYHQNDVPAVLQTLNSSVQHNNMYAGLCKAIRQYWEIPMDVLLHTDKVDISTNLTSKMEVGECLTPSLDLLSKKSHDVTQLPESEKVVNCLTDCSSENMRDSVDKSKCTKEQACRLTSNQVELKLAGKSNTTQYASCTLNNSSSDGSGNANDTCLIPDMSNNLTCRTSFKAHGYINHYTHGNYAASAAANLAILSCKEPQFSELKTSISLQVKAFSSAAIWFFWPDSENKVVKVPRERCGWCISCKAPPQSKKGCLLNAAASNAIRGMMRNSNVACPIMEGQKRLYGIVAYMISLEENLHSLVVGPFQSPGYRKLWREQAKQVTTCSAVKSLLLELEENIRVIAFTRDWVKHVDEWSVESTISQNTTSAVGSSLKRGPGGRRDRKQGAVPEVTAYSGQDKSKNFIWWRGGILPKHIFHRGILPCSMAKKSARQGCSRKIPSVSYAEGLEVPKRTRQFVWRAAVEMSLNISELAMQIRNLDIHVRWGDLVRPEQSTLDGKGAETQAYLFRNAFICEKRDVESQTQYAVNFGGQKEFPSRITKNVVEVDISTDGKPIYWFLETRVPLYLIKEYEENMEKTHFHPAKKVVSELSELQRRQMKASRKDIFAYLLRRRDNLESCHCASCQLDVLIRNAVKCTRCKGYCHVECTVSSSPHMNEEIKFLVICKHCQTEAIATNEKHIVTDTNCLLLKEPQKKPAVAKDNLTSGRKIEESQYTPTLHKGGKGTSNMPLALDHSHEKSLTRNKSSSKLESRSKLCSWGLIWKKKSGEETGFDFRLKNILLKGNPNFSDVRCDLCKKPYNSDLMYISCETCKKWYHADAVELDESKLFALLGFRCCKCRRIKSPVCPYSDPGEKTVSRGRKMRKKALQHGSIGVEDQIVCTESGDPSGSLVEHVTDEKNPEVNTESMPISQNTSVNRHMMQSNAPLCSSVYSLPADLSAPVAENPAFESYTYKGTSISKNDQDDGVMFDDEGFNYEDMEFEPQTYFAQTEFGTSIDGHRHLNGVEPSGSMTENMKKSSTLSSSINTEHYGRSTNQQARGDISTLPVHVEQCQICFLTEPSPDCCCEVCGQWMHSHCSPAQELSGQMSWTCVNCREWQ